MSARGAGVKEPIFSRPALILLIACATGLFALSILLGGYERRVAASGNPSDPGSYSVSALGHAGFYDTLRRMGLPVFRGTGNTRALAGRRGTLIIAEPDLRHFGQPDATKMTGVPRLLLVLPKRRGVPDPLRPEWLAETRLLHPSYALRVLGLATADGDVFHTTWPQGWAINETGFSPSGDGPLQLMRSETMRALVGTEEGILVGELTRNDDVIWVISDPDVLSNHGIVKGENAEFMVALLDALRFRKNESPNAPVVFDETVHGFREAQGSPLQLLFRFPFVAVTALLCAFAVLLVWAGAGRFGAPLVPRPELDFGKSGLIGNGARMLDYAGHHSAVLRRYVWMTVRHVAVTLHAPPGMDEYALATWLDGVGRSGNAHRSCAAILQSLSKPEGGGRKDPDRLFKSAWEVYRWKREMLKEEIEHGSATRRRYR